VRYGVWRSLVARFVRDEEVAGSNPVTPTVERLVRYTLRSEPERLSCTYSSKVQQHVSVRRLQVAAGRHV
jgi:hypothetical protein